MQPINSGLRHNQAFTAGPMRRDVSASIGAQDNQATPWREIVFCTFAAGVLAGKMAVIFVPKALESTINSPRN
jgi:hypothetical protein